MNDFELWNAYCIAQKYADDLEAVCRKRGLFEKPFVQWSHLTSVPADSGALADANGSDHNTAAAEHHR